jgi:hypothetical protein
VNSMRYHSIFLAIKKSVRNIDANLHRREVLYKCLASAFKAGIICRLLLEITSSFRLLVIIYPD